MSLKEEEIRPVDMVREQQEYIRRDRESLLRQSDKFQSVPCPACESCDATLAFTKNGLSYQQCDKCSTLFVNPRPTPSILNNFYAESEVYKYWGKTIFPASDQARLEAVCRPRVRRLLRLCKEQEILQPRLLEIGAGFGTFCQTALDSGKFHEIVAIEPHSDSAEVCHRRGFETIATSLDSFQSQEREFNLIASFEVIEHVFSPREFLKACWNLLEDHGLLCLTCPNVDGFDISVLKERSQSIDHEHLNYFSLPSLKARVENSGFSVIEALTPGELDAEIVRNTVLRGEFDLSTQPFLQRILIDEWESLGKSFQEFLATNLLSSHLWLVAKKDPDAH